MVILDYCIVQVFTILSRLLLVSEPTQQKDLIIWTLGENTETMSVFEPPVIPRLKDMKGKGVQNS